jgi:hypothetical protein
MRAPSSRIVVVMSGSPACWYRNIGMRARSSCVRSSPWLLYTTTRSGFSEKMRSTSGSMRPPTFVRVAASGGYRSKLPTPITRGPAPMANNISVVEGMMETMRSGGVWAGLTPGATIARRPRRTISDVL